MDLDCNVRVEHRTFVALGLNDSFGRCAPFCLFSQLRRRSASGAGFLRAIETSEFLARIVRANLGNRCLRENNSTRSGIWLFG